MIIVIITVLLTIVIMQNNESVYFNFLFATFHTSKLWMLLSVAFIAFIVGVLVGRPGKPRYIQGVDEQPDPSKKLPGTLSDEDRDYIN